MIALIAVIYLAIGLWFHPYGIGGSVIKKLVLHIFWLPIVIALFLLFKFGNPRVM